MQYTVVHSKDPYLLARLATELLMEGRTWRSDGEDIYDMFDTENEFEWLDCNMTNSFNIQCHPCGNNPTRHELTSRNYIKVLTQILEP